MYVKVRSPGTLLFFRDEGAASSHDHHSKASGKVQYLYGYACIYTYLYIYMS
jgi:hypothetical protein